MDKPVVVHASDPPSGAAVPMPPGDEHPILVARSVSYSAGARIASHRHVRGQFLFAAAGTMSVRTSRHAWLVPPSRALWIPAGVEHAIHAQSALQMRTLYLDTESAATLPADCAVLEVTALLRELILRLTASPEDTGSGDPTVPLAARLAVAEIGRLSRSALELPLPRSADLLELCERVLADPSRAADPQLPPLSARTLYRRFLDETGISFARWRQQASLLEAVRRLTEGQAVTRVALDLGYDSPSAFSTMFKRVLGRSPRAFLSSIAPASRRVDEPAPQRRRRPSLHQ